MKKIFTKAAILINAVLLLAALEPATAQVNFKTKQLSVQLDASGKLTSMKSIALQQEFLVPDKASAIMSIKKDGKIIAPQNCAWSAKNSELLLKYPQDGIEAIVKVQQADSYLSFELKKLTHAE